MKLPSGSIVFRVYLSLLLGLSLASCGREQASVPVQTSPERYQQVPDFHLLNQEAQPVRGADFTGKVWVANFMFTTCGWEGPVVTKRFQALNDRFAGREDVVFVSFTVDPVTDHPKRLSKYAQVAKADSERWLFLTGAPAQVDTLVKETFLLPSAKSGEERDKILMESLLHTDKIAIVDRQGWVRAYVDGMPPGAEDAAAALVEQVLREP